jgi:chemotaxis protein histidine kinase CheA
MTKRYYALAFLIICIIVFLSSCQTYTQRDAKAIIESSPSQSQQPALVTKYSLIEAEKQAKEDALAKQQAQLQALEDAKKQEILDQQMQKEAQEKAEAETLAMQKIEEERKQAEAEDQATIVSLSKENLSLKNQLETLQLAMDKNLRLEKEKAEQARLAEEAKVLEAQKKAQALADAKKASLAESEQARKAREAEIRQIPPLGQITFPRPYATARPIIVAKQGEKLNVLMLPLDDNRWSDEKMAAEVANSISDLHVPVIFLTGNIENVIEMVRLMGYNAVLFEDGAILSDFKITETTPNGMVVQFSDTKSIRLSLVNLPQYSVVQAFLQGKDWKSIQKAESEQRVQKVQEIIKESSTTMPTIIGSSLYEPSYQDWNTFSPIPYRQMEYHWPLCDAFEQEAFYDTYRTTHYTEATDAGNTIKTKDLEERIDYIFSRKVLPLQVSVITEGPESVSGPDGISRYALFGSYLIP